MALYTYQAMSGVSGGGLRVLPGATVTIYQTGTTTRASIYDGNGNPLNNPATADANGLISFNVSEGAYDVVATFGPYLVQQTIQVVLAPGRKLIFDANYTASAADVGVGYASLKASRGVILPPLASMALGKAFIVADDSGSASSTVQIVIAPAGQDMINGSNAASLVINNSYQTISLVAGQKSWSA